MVLALVLPVLGEHARGSVVSARRVRRLDTRAAVTRRRRILVGSSRYDAVEFDRGRRRRLLLLLSAHRFHHRFAQRHALLRIAVDPGKLLALLAGATHRLLVVGGNAWEGVDGGRLP